MSQKFKNKDFMIAPRSDKQYRALRSNADYILLTGTGGSGKTSIAVIDACIRCLTIPNYQLMFFLKNIDDFEKPNGIKEEFFKFCRLRKDGDKKGGNYVGTYVKSDGKIIFNNGSVIHLTHLADERKKTIEQRTKSIQMDSAIFDECQSYEFSTISSYETRMRSELGTRKQIILCQNSTRDCWMFHFAGDGEHGGGWFSAETGEVIPEMNGKMRYVFFTKGSIHTCVWGDSYQEVYEKCKSEIDYLCSTSSAITIKGLIRTVVFLSFSPSDNKEINELNPEYASRVATSTLAGNMGEPNWLHSADDDETTLKGDLSQEKLHNMFFMEPKKTFKRRVVVDFAEEGKDMMTMGYFEGMHLMDLAFSPKNGYNEGVHLIRKFLSKHQLDETALIIDVQGAVALKDSFPRAKVKWSGATAATKRAKGSYSIIKHEAADLLMLMIHNGLISVDNRLMGIPYQAKKNTRRNIYDQIMFEFCALKFITGKTGKRELLPKEEMKKVLRGESPNIMDLFIMQVGGNIFDCYKMLRDIDATKGLDYNTMYSIVGGKRYDEATMLGDGRPKNNGLRNSTKAFSNKFGW